MGAQPSEAHARLLYDQVNELMTIMYCVVEAAQSRVEGLSPDAKKQIGMLSCIRYGSAANIGSVDLQQNMVRYMVTVIARLRWEESTEMSQTKVSGHDTLWRIY